MIKPRSVERWRPWWPWIGLAVFAVLQLCALPGDYLGREHDDAHYVLAARSLLRGEYRLGISPGNPPLTFIPPGWPALLIPAAAVSGDDPIGYHLTAWFFLVACDALVWLWLRRRIGDALAFWATALFALNPLVLLRAGKVMTEIPALALILALCVALDRKRWPAWASSLLLGFLWLVRQRATAVAAAVWCWYAWKRRWRDLAIAATGPLIAVLLWSCWLRHARVENQEFGEWAAAYSTAGDFFAAIGSNVVFYLRLWGHALVPYLPGGPAADLAAGGLFAALCGWGFLRLSRRFGPEPALGWLAFGGLMHLVWPWQYDRYLLPFLPMLLWCLIEALGALRLGFGLIHVVLGALLAGQVIAQDVAILSGRAAVRQPELRETYGWIRAQLPPDAVLASPFFSRDALYAARPFAPLPADLSKDGFLRDLRRERAGYVLFEADADIGLSLGQAGEPARRLEAVRLLLQTPSFRRIYANARERSSIYAVVMN